jgi:integrase
MARAPFSIIERKTAGKSSVFIARFTDDKGKAVKTVSFPKARNRTAATREAEKLLREGIISNASNPDALEYLRGFWTRGSDYVQGRALRGVVLSEAYLSTTLCVLNKHLAPKIKGMRLLDIDADFVEALILKLSSSGVKPRTVNAVLDCLRVPMKYFCKRKRLADPLSVVDRLAEYPRERGILSIAELQKIIALEESPRVKAGVLLAALCGLRLGECCGLMREDVDKKTGMLTIRHNFVAADGMKGPKGSRPGAIRARQVPIPRPVLETIKVCESVAPEGAPFVLWNDKDASRPVRPQTLQVGYTRILEEIGIDEKAKKARNLTFHGLRHGFVSMQRANGIPDFITAQESGHRSVEMLNTYSRGAGNVVDFTAAREAIEKAMEPKKEKAANGEK